jgi:hypothetical protein
MKTWDTTPAGRDAREIATIKFCDFFKDLDATERKKYTWPQRTQAEADAASKLAREKFAELGEFAIGTSNTPNITPMPANLPFRVYEFKPYDKRDDLVTIVLPEPGQAADSSAETYYRCTYWPY